VISFFRAQKKKAQRKYDEIKRSPAQRQWAAGFLRAEPLRYSLTVGVKISIAKQVYEDKTAHITKQFENMNVATNAKVANA
jgi:hypothetical protein